MIQIELTRNLIGLEDLLTGEGTVEQTRGGSTVNMTKINAKNFPYETGVTLDDKLQELQTLAESLSVVDTEGAFLTGYINTSDSNLDLEDRLWRKTPSAGVAEIWYDTVRVLQYNRVTGDLIVPSGTDYVAADTALEASLTSYIDAADAVLDASITALSNSLGTASTLDVGTGANEIVKLDGSSKLPAVDGSALLNILPIGSILFVAYSTPDTNFLECDGSAISRTTYATLFAKIGTTYGAGDGSTTFNIPDCRGEFIRGWDNGRGIDTGRSLGSLQSDTLKAHTHSIGYIVRNYVSGGGNVSLPPVGASATGTYNSNSTGDSETRPRNVAFMFQIKVL